MPFKSVLIGGSIESHSDAHHSAKEAESQKAPCEDSEAREEGKEANREGGQSSTDGVADNSSDLERGSDAERFGRLGVGRPTRATLRRTNLHCKSQEPLRPAISGQELKQIFVRVAARFDGVMSYFS
jgi:hypothetical protein